MAGCGRSWTNSTARSAAPDAQAHDRRTAGNRVAPACCLAGAVSAGPGVHRPHDGGLRLMSPSGESLFPPRGERGYAAAAVERFPWPVIAGYEDVHRWMDQGQAVHAAWQLRDVWEGLLKFLATLAVPDHLVASSDDGSQTKKLLSQLLNMDGLIIDNRVTSMEVAIVDVPVSGTFCTST